VLIGLCFISLRNSRKYILLENTDVAAFFVLSLVLFGMLLVREAFDLCMMKVIVSEDVYRYDIENYIHDSTKIQLIKEDIMATRNLQLMHSVEVDTKDKQLELLFHHKNTEASIIQSLSRLSIQRITSAGSLPSLDTFQDLPNNTTQSNLSKPLILPKIDTI
jgi:hypothetical protein